MSYASFNFCFQIQLAALHLGESDTAALAEEAVRAAESGADVAKMAAAGLGGAATARAKAALTGRGSRSFTSQLNLSRFSHTAS
jgi:hypothetical protein